MPMPPLETTRQRIKTDDGYLRPADIRRIYPETLIEHYNSPTPLYYHYLIYTNGRDRFARHFHNTEYRELILSRHQMDPRLGHVKFTQQRMTLDEQI